MALGVQGAVGMAAGEIGRGGPEPAKVQHYREQTLGRPIAGALFDKAVELTPGKPITLHNENWIITKAGFPPEAPFVPDTLTSGPWAKGQATSNRGAYAGRFVGTQIRQNITHCKQYVIIIIWRRERNWGRTLSGAAERIVTLSASGVF